MCDAEHFQSKQNNHVKDVPLVSEVQTVVIIWYSVLHPQFFAHNDRWRPHSRTAVISFDGSGESVALYFERKAMAVFEAQQSQLLPELQ